MLTRSNVDYSLASDRQLIDDFIWEQFESKMDSPEYDAIASEMAERGIDMSGIIQDLGDFLSLMKDKYSR